jgi:hypothetical protein
MTDFQDQPPTLCKHRPAGEPAAVAFSRRLTGHPASQPAPRYQFPTIEKGSEL